MNSSKIRDLVGFALALAGENKRGLSKTYLLKLVYLADVAHAARHDGVSFSGVPWQFFHFGPWDGAAATEVEQLLAWPKVSTRTVPTPNDDDALVGWLEPDDVDINAIEGHLPLEVSSSARRSIRDFPTSMDIVTAVYRTEPMLRAAPRELLDLSAVAGDLATETPLGAEGLAFKRGAPRGLDGSAFEVAVLRDLDRDKLLSPSATQRPSATQQKRRLERMKALRDELTAELTELVARDRAMVVTAPIYDDVFADGMLRLESEAGGDPPEKANATIDDSVWKSAMRRTRDG